MSPTCSICPSPAGMSFLTLFQSLDGKVTGLNYCIIMMTYLSQVIVKVPKLDPKIPAISGCPFSDESLQSKKLLPNFNHKSARSSKASQWQHRLKNTPESCLLALQMVSNQWGILKSIERRRPLSRTQLKEQFVVCALACALLLLVLHHSICPMFVQRYPQNVCSKIPKVQTPTTINKILH